MSLEEYFKLNHILKSKFNWSLLELENLVVWERDVYVDLILNSKESNGS